jgi:hypothetical protein
MDNAMPAVLPGRDLHLGTIIGSIECARLVGLTSIRFLTFSTKADQSVLFSATHGEGRYEHFFAPLNLRSASDLSKWIFDRFVLTGPTLFLFAYTVGVWLRHQFPGPPSSPAEAPR